VQDKMGVQGLELVGVVREQAEVVREQAEAVRGLVEGELAPVVEGALAPVVVSKARVPKRVLEVVLEVRPEVEPEQVLERDSVEDHLAELPWRGGARR
jgi:hypothetical protein